MHEVAAYSTALMTLSLVVTRPRIAAGRRVNPAAAALIGVLVMFVFGIIGVAAVAHAVADLWRSFIAIAAIMVMTDVAQRIGLLEQWASLVESRARTTVHLFGLVFALGVLTASCLNNDAAILLLTPLVVALVRRRFPGQPALIVPFAFAVFMAAGVAPLAISNPMNMVVADYAGIGFNSYALHMAPIAVMGWIIGYLVLRIIFRRQLATPYPAGTSPAPHITSPQWAMMGLLAAVLCSYSIAGYFGAPVWAVAVAGAVCALWLAHRHTDASPVALIRDGVSWETLAFLLGVLVLALGLLNVGLVEHLAGAYPHVDLAGIGVISALGSAVLNNHPMAYLNMMALDLGTQPEPLRAFAALIGGDLGPRLLPMGSLAGLLWLEMLRRQRIRIGLAHFAWVGALVTIPTLTISLLLLALMR